MREFWEHWSIGNNQDFGYEKNYTIAHFSFKSLDLKNDFFIQELQLNILFQPDDLKKSFDSWKLMTELCNIYKVVCQA